LPVAVGVTPGAVEMQTIAALMGNSLPPAYKTKDDASHEATLTAVTDALKYVATGTTAGEKAAEAAKNLQDVIAMTVSVQQNIKVDITAPIPLQKSIEGGAPVVVQQNIIGVMAIDPVQKKTNEVIVTGTVQQNISGVVVADSVQLPVNETIATVVPVVQASKDATVVPVVQASKDATGVPVVQVSKDTTVTVITDQVALNQASAKPEKKKNEVAKSNVSTESGSGANGMVSGINISVMPIASLPAATNSVPADMPHGEASLSYTKTSTNEVKSSLAVKVTGDALQSTVVLGQSVQGKPDFNLKYFENTLPGEKATRIEQSIPIVEGEKTLARVGGGDLVQLNKPLVDIKVDVPAITKPLTHPEWNKDLGERIVWMSSKAIPTAEIRLNPPHLGPISVRVNVVDDQATVVFSAQHAATREAIDASIPRLREMMGAQQLNLVEVSVFQNPGSDQGRSHAQNFAQTAGGFGKSPATVDGVDDIEQEIDSGRALVSKGLLSLYA
jgi:flagellar hook-length control protein FliK